MSSSKNRLQVFEHHTLKVDEESPFKITHFNALEKYGYKTKKKFFSVGNKRIKFNNYVGVIQVKNLTIEILPKADNKGEDEASYLLLVNFLQAVESIFGTATPYRAAVAQMWLYNASI